MTRELAIVELGDRAAVPLDLENQPQPGQRVAWVIYLAAATNIGSGADG